MSAVSRRQSTSWWRDGRSWKTSAQRCSIGYPTDAIATTVAAVPKLVLIDGNSIAYRAFYALPEDLATKSGQVTNAVFGFTRMLIRLLKDIEPDGIAVAWDVSRK